MKLITTKQYTIRGVPLPVDRALRRIAEDRNTSINDILILSLEKLTGISAKQSNGMKKFAGAIPLEQSVEEALLAQRTVFEKEWR